MEKLFRGISIEDNKMVFGDLSHNTKLNSIEINYDINGYKFENLIFTETAGQYLGFDDEHDNKIFEGDIVRCDNPYYHGENSEYYYYCIKNIEELYEDYDIFMPAIRGGDGIVIGNVHQNKGLIKLINKF